MPSIQDNKLRERDRRRKRAKHRQATVVSVPDCHDRVRREELEADDIAWLMHYFSVKSGTNDPFWYEFTSQQREMIAAIGNAITYGGDQALAASRGEGKTTLFERVLLKYTLQGTVDFTVLFAATGTAAANSLDSIKQAIEDNAFLLADYPEVCIPVAALENTPNRAHYQICSGYRHDNGERYKEISSKFSWCGQELIFPSVPGSPSSGSIIATRGLDSAVRGLKRRGKRPQVCGIDDPDTDETVNNEEQAAKLEDRIDKSIGGLGGQQKRVARVILTTCQNRTCVSYRYTNPKEKPTFKGRRFRYLISPPDRLDLWEEYAQLASEAYESFALGEGEDEYAREAHKFYLDNRKAMDAGSEVANENRFDSTVLPDGSQIEVSSLQRYYNEVARIGEDAVNTEYNNDPPEELGPVESGITAHRIQTQVSGYARKDVPPGCILITQGIDCRKIALHWVVRAWMEDGTGFTVDYGLHEITGTQRGSDEGVDVLLKKAIEDRMSDFADTEYMIAGGEVLNAFTLVDAGWRTHAVYHACVDLGADIMPAMGFGKSAGCVTMNFTEQQRMTQDKRPGDGWFLAKKKLKLADSLGMVRNKSLWMVAMDTDRWKAYEHDRWMTDPGKPGTMMLWGDESDVPRRMSADQKGHFSYAKHITAEVEIEEVIKGVLKRRWKSKRDNNHWLDASYMSHVAAGMRGIKLMHGGPIVKQVSRSLAEMKAQAR